MLVGENFETRRFANRGRGSSWRQQTGCRINAENNEIIRVLIGNDQMFPWWENLEVSRCETLRTNMLEKRQMAGREINREDRNRVMTSIRDIEVFFCDWMEEKFGAGVRSREAAWKSRNGLQWTKRRKVIVDRHRGFKFIQNEDEFIVGIEHQMSRTVA